MDTVPDQYGHDENFSPACSTWGTVFVDRVSEELMKRLKESESTKQHEHSPLPEISTTEPKQTQASPQLMASADELEYLRKLKEQFQNNGHDAVDKNMTEGFHS